MGRGEVLTLANGWRLARRRIMGNSRLEIEGPDDRHVTTLKRLGCTVEIVSWSARVFAPDAVVLARVLERPSPRGLNPHVRPARIRMAVQSPSGGGRSVVSIRIAVRPMHIAGGRRQVPPPFKGVRSMTSQTLPKNPDYAFCPAYGPGNEPQEIRLVIDGMSGSIATAMVALTLEDGETPLRQAQRPARNGPGGLVRTGRTRNGGDSKRWERRLSHHPATQTGRLRITA